MVSVHRPVLGSRSRKADSRIGELGSSSAALKGASISGGGSLGENMEAWFGSTCFHYERGKSARTPMVGRDGINAGWRVRAGSTISGILLLRASYERCQMTLARFLSRGTGISSRDAMVLRFFWTLTRCTQVVGLIILPWNIDNSKESPAWRFRIWIQVAFRVGLSHFCL